MYTTYSLQDALGKCTGSKNVYAIGVPCMYTVCSDKKFWQTWMLPRASAERNYFEVIQTDRPSHLYIDLDVDLVKYPNIDVNDVWEMVRSYIDPQLREKQIEVEECLVMDSSNHKKGSIHVVYRFKDYIFENNANVGAFMRSCMEKRVIHHKENYQTWKTFVDMTVYSRNRLFRLLGCTKKDENRVKRMVEKERFNYDNWRRSKVQPTTTKLQMISCPEPDGSEVKYNGTYKVNLPGYHPEYLTSVKEFASTIGNVRAVTYNPRSMNWCINLDKKYCIFKKDRHKNNTMYMVVNTITNEYNLRCWCMKYDCCRQGRTPDTKLPDRVCKEIDEYMDFKISPSILKL